jgi:hypothetical protein
MEKWLDNNDDLDEQQDMSALGQMRLCWLMRHDPNSMFLARGSSEACSGLLRVSTVVFKATFQNGFELTNRVR